MDMKPLARVPQGGGHRLLGRSPETKRRSRGVGYEVVHVAVDDTSRLAFAQILPDGRGPTTAQFLIAAAAYLIEKFEFDGGKINELQADHPVFRLLEHVLESNPPLVRGGIKISGGAVPDWGAVW